jgi:hypothetical protein
MSEDSTINPLQPSGVPVARPSKQGYHVYFKKLKIQVCGKCVNVQKLPNEKGIVITLFLMEESLEKIRSMDESAIQLAVQKNQEWWNNQLTETIIREYYNTSCRYPQHMNFVIPYTNNPSKIAYGKETFVNLSELIEAKNIQQHTLHLTIIPKALRYYAKACGLIWTIQDFQVIDPTDDDDLDVSIDRDEIESYWKERIQEITQSIDKDIKALQKYQSNLSHLLAQAQNSAEPNEFWASTLETLSHSIVDYEPSFYLSKV